MPKMLHSNHRKKNLAKSLEWCTDGENGLNLWSNRSAPGGNLLYRIKKGRKTITAQLNPTTHAHVFKEERRLSSCPSPPTKADLQICQKGKYVEMLRVKCLFLVGWTVIKHFVLQRSSIGTWKNFRTFKSLRDSTSWIVADVFSLSPNRNSQNLRPCQAPARLQSHRTCMREARL